ncbi:MAG: hypothetical protein PQJ59_09910 [Spirochaetales bacterium]|nr:hypothetical protein [Spirochaetales bacterium]
MKRIFTLAASVFILMAGALFAEGTAEGSSVAMGDIAEELEINFTMGNNSRTMTYQKANPLPLPDGTIITQGDLKPTWQYIEKQLGFNIIDNAVQDQKAVEMIDIAAATGFTDSTVYGGNSIAESLMKYGALGYMVNLKENLDKMPHFKEYLENNPEVAKAITAYDGGIYHVPYIAAVGKFARGFGCRPAWVKGLLDSTSQLENETETITVAYEGYWDRYDNNVIALQNAASRNGVLDREAALKALLDYIKVTHPDLAKPSDLYLGETAVYDIDELAALLRVVELSPNTVSKIATGSVVPDAEISPYFVRQSKSREDLLRLVTYFDGEKVYSSDSYGAKQYVDAKGNIKFSYAEESFLEKIEYIRQWYSEGLIHSEFADVSTKDNFRKSLLFSDEIDGQRQFGFMTMDWVMSTTTGTEKVEMILPPVTTISKAGINKFVHYIENTRVIKPDGWAISTAAPEDQKNAAFLLFDYIFTEEGSQVQSYSIPAGLEEGKSWVGPDGKEYPMLNQWTRDTAKEFKNGDIAGFLRDFMGSFLSIGYPMEIGAELQVTPPHGFDGWALWTNMGVISPTYDAENLYLRLMPPVISLNEQDVAKLGSVAVGEDQTDMIFQYITGNSSTVSSVSDIRQKFVEAGIETYLDVYQAAYDRMMSK